MTEQKLIEKNDMRWLRASECGPMHRFWKLVYTRTSIRCNFYYGQGVAVHIAWRFWWLKS